MANFGRYEIIKEVGKGSMGIVYHAHDPQIDRLVALKVLREDRLISETFVQRFLKEAKAIGRLSHPNVVTVFDVGNDHGTIYIAMELLEGEPLNKVILEKKFSPKEIATLGIQVAETLDYAHQKGIVHRDVKPSNIILQPTGQIKITDFGIARIEDPSMTQQTQAGEILGTPAYMSPEQVLSELVDGRSDLFSVGIILYEMCTGKRPFEGENMAALFNNIVQSIPLPPAEIHPSISPKLSKIIMKCLRKNREERFETGKALSEALKGYLREEEEKEAVKVPIPSKRSKRALFLLFLIIITLSGIGGGAYYYFTAKKLKPSPTVESGFMKVESTPAGAQVFVNGTPKGVAPVRLELPAGKYEVRLTLVKYYDWEAQVQLKEKGELPLLVRLIPIEERKP